jgi:hypothetical protein
MAEGAVFQGASGKAEVRPDTFLVSGRGDNAAGRRLGRGAAGRGASRQPLNADRALIDVQRPASHRSDRLTGRYLQDVFRHAERSTPTLDADFVNDVIARATGRRQQLQRRYRVVAAAAALILTIAGGASALTPEPAPPPKAAGAAAGAPLTWADAWPNTRITRFVAELEDGRSYRPLRFVDLRTALALTLGPTPPAQLVLVDLNSRTAQSLGTVTEPVDEIATATDGFHVSWISTRRGNTELWIADVKRRSPRLVTTVPPLSPRAHPWALGMGAGRLYLVRWRGAEHHTVEILSIRHTGGPLRNELTLPGYVPVGWPWFSTVARSANQDVQIRNALTGAERVGRLPRGSALGVCDGMWCVGTLRSDGVRMDGEVLVGQLDGSHRRSVALARPEIGPPPVMAGRFVLVRSHDEATYLHDLRQDQRVRLAGTVRHVVPSGRYFGWSVGTPHGTRWRLADLAPLP